MVGRLLAYPGLMCAMWDAINIYNDADLENTVTPRAPRKGGAVGPMMLE